MNTKQCQRLQEDALWLPPLAPQQMLILCSLGMLSGLVVACLLATRQPSLGLTWAPTHANNGLLIKKVDDHLDGFKAGDHLVSIGASTAEPIQLTKALLVEDPDLYGTYADYNRFFHRPTVSPLLTPIASHNFLLYQSLPMSIHP